MKYPYKICINGVTEYSFTNQASAMQKFTELSKEKATFTILVLYYKKAIKRYVFGTQFQPDSE